MSNVINLNCPSCGAKLEIPDNTNIVHCSYCRTEIQLAEPIINNDQQQIYSYLDICVSAIKTQNYLEALDYSNKILGINSKCVDAWLHKAVATFGLSTESDNRYEEAISYLNTAFEIDSANPKIVETKKGLSELQALWFYKLGNEYLHRAMQIMNIWSADFSPSGMLNARNISREMWSKAAYYYMQALRFEPDNIEIASSFSELVKNHKWMDWSKAAVAKTSECEKLLHKFETENKQRAKETLHKYNDALKKAENELHLVKQEKGPVSDAKKSEAEKSVKEIKKAIANLKKTM